jgi:hypothetical protein
MVGAPRFVTRGLSVIVEDEPQGDAYEDRRNQNLRRYGKREQWGMCG